MTNSVTKDRLHFEDLAAGQIIALGHKKLTKSMIINFAKKYDPFPFHLDEKAAKASLLGGLAASGYQTSGLSLRMLVDNFLSNVASEGGLNFTDLKWKRPVFVNDTLTGTATIVELRRLQSRPHWGSVTLDFDMRNQNDETVMTMNLTNLVTLRNPEATFVFEARLMPTNEGQE